MGKNYAPEGMWLWDSWFIQKDNKNHMFHLQSKVTNDYEKRSDDFVSIGHAISGKNFDWKRVGTFLVPGKSGDWDSLSLWTGGLIKKDELYYMFYTGRSNAESKKNIQKIGLAISKDLINWKKFEENPIIEADNVIYDMSNSVNFLGKIAAWRDPFIFKEDNSEFYYMILCARKKGIKKEYNGCIAVLKSKDLFNWELCPPILAPEVYDEMEVPQMIIHDGKYYLFFSTHFENYEPSFAKKYGGLRGRHCYYSDSLFGEYKPVNGNGIIYSYEDKIYDLSIVKKEKDILTAIGWLNKDKDGNFVGKTSNPVKLKIDGDKIHIID